MFVIWGWRPVREVLCGGPFHCPACGRDVEYAFVRLRRWFTFFFIPVFPLGRLEPFVECTTCRSAFREEVLLTPTSEQLLHHLGLASRAALAHVIGSAGSSERAAREAVRLLDGAPGVGPYDQGRLWPDVAAFTDRTTAQLYVATAARHLAQPAREDLARRVLTLAATWAPDRTSLTSAPVDAVAFALEISPTHLAGIRHLVPSLSPDGAA